MKTIILTFFLIFPFIFPVKAQEADEIIKNYIKKSGGIDTWKNVSTMKLTVNIDQAQMQLNGVIYRKAPDLQRSEIEVQGMTIIQAYDGTTGWFINPMMGSEDPQKMPDEMTEVMKEETLESEFINYSDKGHKVELVGNEEVEGMETFKIKLTKNNGDIEYYFFDTDKYLPVKKSQTIKAGPATGQQAETFMRDYREVSGLMMPHNLEIMAGGQSMQNIKIEEYVVNLALEDSMFAFPGE